MSFHAAFCSALLTLGLMNMPHGPSGMHGSAAGHFGTVKPTAPAIGELGAGVNSPVSNVATASYIMPTLPWSKACLHFAWSYAPTPLGESFVIRCWKS